MGNPSLYIASPLGFSEAGRFFYEKCILPDVRKIGFDILDPWALTDKKLFTDAFAFPFGPLQKAALARVNQIAGRNNEEAIRAGTMMLAILDGPDVDSGTASEIGFAAGLVKPIIGYRGDFRLSSDNIGSTVNLAVERFITICGGSIFTTWEETRGILYARYFGYKATA
ncbi:nucleoside 2-deoxyribosyltransferase [Candidatus Kaiserbacteria bacterium]|nr:nucleoside 2-deoxyribosyltransferase [Candidatus Kaiserbacteria bacterium]